MVFVGALVPDDLNSIINGELGEIVERVELAESGGPVEVAPTVSGQNERTGSAFGGAEIRNAPDALFKNIFPI